MLRLRRTAHEHHRRGTAGSPCPQSLRSFAGSTPSGDFVPHCLRQRLPLSGFPVGRRLKKALASGPAGAKNSEEWRAICKQIVRRYRNRPEGGMFATEYYARACMVESNLCPARRRRGKRALLWGCAVPSLLNGHCGRVNRLSGALGVRNYHLHQLRAL